MTYDERVEKMTPQKLWSERHELTVALGREIGSSTMDLVDYLLTVEREIVRRGE